MKIYVQQAEIVIKHCKQLLELARTSKTQYMDGWDIYMKLRRLERKASRCALAYSEGTIDQKEKEETFSIIEKQVSKILPGVRLSISQNPRGYHFLRALNVPKVISYLDLAGYQILCPDF